MSTNNNAATKAPPASAHVEDVDDLDDLDGKHHSPPSALCVLANPRLTWFSILTL